MDEDALHRSWQKAWRGLGARDDQALCVRLLARYAEPHRRYHTLQHLAECLETLDRNLDLAHHGAQVAVALWFHDAVYDVMRTDNEEVSARWATEEMVRAGVPAETVTRVHDMVFVTRHAARPRTPDEALVVDVDLAILGASRERFLEYESQVRQEYAWVPEPVFRRERRAILEQFLAQPTIYTTPRFQRDREATARENLRSSIARLAD